MTNFPKNIVKRDGSVVVFDSIKIQAAIEKALVATGYETEGARDVAMKVCEKLGVSGDDPTVEQCQDIVEEELMSEYPKASKAYILYRDNRSRIRASENSEKIVIPEELKNQASEALSYFESPYNYLVYLRTYSKWLPELGRREIWPETVKRYMDFMREIVGNKLEEKEYQELHDAILNMEVLPSMRMLQFAGEPIRRNNICAYNCSFVAPRRLRDFHDTMLILMCGCGVGFSVEKKFVDQLPIIKHQQGISSSMGLSASEENNEDYTVETHVIGDSREGWCHALLLGLEHWYDGKDIKFDYSLIRPAGARLVTSGGRASGPAPLKELLEFARSFILDNQGGKLSTINVHDLMCKIGTVVVAGGTRRSSMISLSDLSDDVMRNAKAGSFWNTHPDRCMANNSAVYNKRPTDAELLMEWNSLVQSNTGERGIFNRGNLIKHLPERRLKMIGKMIKNMGTNPCLPGDVKILTVEGEIMVKDLVGRQVDLIVNGERKKMLSNGFYHTGRKSTLAFVTSCGRRMEATGNHPFCVLNDNGVKKKNLIDIFNDGYRDILCMNNGRDTTIEMVSPGPEQDVYDVTVEDHVFVANDFLVGNCGEIWLLLYEFCNLSTVVMREHDTRDTLINKVRLATILGTYQSMLTDFKDIAPEWKEMAEMERLLGVSLNGQRDCKYLMKNIEILNALKQQAILTNKIYADRFDINTSNAITTTKPEGTSSQMLGCASGIHPRFAPYYIRRIRISATDPLAKMLIDQGVPYHPENNQNIDNVTTWVFEFPQKSPDGAVCAENLSALDQLNYWKEVKTRYTEHNPSCTIYVRKNEWITTLNWIQENWDIVGGLSFLPYGDHIYALAPYEKITKEQYEKLVREMPNIDFSKLVLYEKDDNTERKTQWACLGDKCEMV
jgi:ribonucleotide reductase alpha subunit